MLAAHAASPINKTTYMLQIRPLKDWRLFHSQGWHTTWSAQPNLIFTPPSLVPSFTAPPLSGTVSPIEIIFHYRCHHPSSSFSLPHDIQSRAGYWHFQFFKTICTPLAVVFSIDQRSTSNDISSVIHLEMLIKKTVFTSSTYHFSSLCSLSCLEGFKVLLVIHIACPHFMSFFFLPLSTSASFKIKKRAKRWQKRKYWIRVV